MTEQEWLTSTNPQAMLRWMKENKLPQCGWVFSDRKLRLFAEQAGCQKCAYLCRLDSAAQYAEQVSGASCRTPAEKATILRDIFGNPFRSATLPYRCRECGIPCGPPAAGYYCVKCGCDESFCPWLRWRDGFIPAMARAIYDERHFDEMPILADALEEADCTDEEILDHLRGLEWCPGCSRGETTEWYGGGGGWCAWCDCSGPELHKVPIKDSPLGKPNAQHVRGCWVLDLLLGKE